MVRAPMQRRTLLRYAGLATAALLTSGCAKRDDTPVVVGTNIWLGYEPVYLADSRALYKDYDVDIRQFSSATEVLRAFRNEAVDVAALTLDEAITLARSGVAIKIILVADISHGADAIIARPPIVSMAQLKGKRIGVENSALGAYVLSRALAKHGMTPADVSQVSLTVDETVEYFGRGDVDAVVSFEPFKSQLLRQNGRKIFDSSQIPDEIFDVLVARETFASAHPEVLRAVVAGWLAGGDLVRRRVPAALAEMEDRLKLSSAELSRALAEIRLPTAEENRALLSGANSPVAQVGARLLPFLTKRGEQVRPIDPRQLTTPDFLPDTPR